MAGFAGFCGRPCPRLQHACLAGDARATSLQNKFKAFWRWRASCPWLACAWYVRGVRGGWGWPESGRLSAATAFPQSLSALQCGCTVVLLLRAKASLVLWAPDRL